MQSTHSIRSVSLVPSYSLPKSGGVTSAIVNRGMTRAPVVSMPSVTRALALKNWLEMPENFEKVSEVFNSTSKFGRLINVTIVIVEFTFEDQSGSGWKTCIYEIQKSHW